MKYYVAVLIGVATVIVPVFTQDLNEDAVNNCTLTGGSLNNLNSIQQRCTSITIQDLTVPAGQTLSLTALKAGSTVTFNGLIRFGYAEWTGDLIVVSGTNITIIGGSGHLFDCHGERWWDGLGANNGKLKPTLFQTNNLLYSNVRGLRIKNTPARCFAIQSSQHVVFSNIIIDNLDGNSNGGHNTDGFDLNENNDITIQYSQIVNQDDCFAINSGTNCYFYHNHCSGGHGISIGSVGDRRSNVVRNVHVRNCTVVNSENGIRIKTIANATGQVLDITYEDVTMQNITNYGIVVRGDYRNSGPTGHPTGGFSIKNLTLSNIQGWVQRTAINVMVLLAGGVASEWRWTRVNVTGSRFAHINNCTGVPPNSGVEC
ncbi:polygalacturonase-like [Agrilus planipennis]|uniref:endo-polygalacturonase n=1 Tax=Agrilus planipennis TaxID=224129 RepID=A0A1W4XAW0_AGRPL|nr:polygalacturonase-like [Agrilus planipennis]